MNGGLIIPDEDTVRALNNLARHKAIVRILNDIRMDMEICEIEGWDKNEYLNLIRQLLNSIGGKTMDDLISRQAAIDCATCDVEHTIGCLKALPPAAPTTTQTTETTAPTTETTAPTTDDWITVERELPEDLAEVNVTWVNHGPEPYRGGEME